MQKESLSMMETGRILVLINTLKSKLLSCYQHQNTFGIQKGHIFPDLQ